VITFALPGGRFTYRAVAVLVHEEHVLLHRAERDEFWSLPGGRCELFETAATAVRRELREELGTDVTVERLLWVVENFFVLDVPHHELGLYYLVSLPPESGLLDVSATFAGQEEHVPLIFRWFPVADLAELPLYPVFLRNALRSVPDTIQHIVVQDNRLEESNS
jgi:8-oxo-dGTP pyrophosphatase MutT (NUDIX family)